MAARPMLAALAMAVLLPLAWTGGPWHPPPRVSDLVAETPYVVAVANGRAMLDLPFAAESRYVLIVSSLAPAHVVSEVRLTSERVAAVEHLPIQPLPALRATRWTTPLPAPHSEPDRFTARDAARGERTFALHVTDGDLNDARHSARITGRLVGEGRAIRVYLDRQLPPEHLAPGVVDDIVRRFDGEILPCARRWLGDYRDVDGDGKFTVLLTPWLGRLQGGKTSLGGLVRGSDFRRDLPRPLSNHCDMMFLNANLRPGPHLRTLLAHEFAHAVCFSRRLPGGNHRSGLPTEEDWLSEAVAHLAENLHGPCWTNLDHRIGGFLDSPPDYPLVVEDYYGSGLWRNHGCRGATYLFLRWCVDRYGNGLLARLIRSPFRGRRNVEWATGVPFDQLFRHWSVALFQSGRHAATAGSARPANSSQCLTTLDLYDRLGEWGLAGPHLQTWSAERRHRVSLRGTTSAFVLVRPERSGGVRRIRIAADPGAPVQVTLIPLASAWPAIQLTARRAGRTPHAGTAHRDATSPMVNVTLTMPPGVALTWIACESHDRPSPHSVCWTADELRQRGGMSPSPAGGPVRLTLPIPDSGAQPREWVLSVLAADAAGRRATARAVVPAASAGDERLELATTHPPREAATH